VTQLDLSFFILYTTVCIFIYRCLKVISQDDQVILQGPSVQPLLQGPSVHTISFLCISLYTSKITYQLTTITQIPRPLVDTHNLHPLSLLIQSQGLHTWK
jgi:hypothetical protein